VTVREEIRYGTAPSQFVDMWNAEGGRDPRALIVMLHGGWWRDTYDRHLMDGLCADLAGRGWAVANVEYRRAEGGSRGAGVTGGWPQTLDDVLAAVDEVRAKRPELAVLPAVSVGHSAGGHLALLAAAHHRVDAAIGLAPITDLARCVAEDLGQGSTPVFLGTMPDADPAAYRHASPLHRVPLGRPHVVLHGELDDRIPIDHSRDYVSAAKAAGDPAELVELAGTDHFDVIDPGHPSWAVALRWAERWTEQRG
jgi:acetyl esterase/lipase